MMSEKSQYRQDHCLRRRFATPQSRAAKSAYRVHVSVNVDVNAIRTKLNLTQQAFAARFGFSVNTLRHWEHGTRQPEGPTRAYLVVIDRAPDVVQKVLRIA